MQLALNEGADAVIVLDPGAKEDFSTIDRLVISLDHKDFEVVISGAPGKELIKLAVTRRSAFVAGLWSRLPSFRHVSEYDDLAWILAQTGQIPWILTNGTMRLYYSRPRKLNSRQILDLFWSTGIRLESISEPPPKRARYVGVITPYYKEDTSKLRRCHESVLRQTGEVTHFMIADGFPNPEVDRWDVQHVSLSAAHGDNGNTPRGIGALLAFGQGFDAVAFLDADNWLADNHISSLLKTQRRRDANIVCSLRHIVLPDGTRVDQMDPEDAKNTHVDTSCFLFTAERRFLACLWSQMPAFCGPVCDRVVFALGRQFRGFEQTAKQTVFFESNYAIHFRMAGKEVEGVHDIPPEIWKRIRQPDHATRKDFGRHTGHLWPF